MRPIGPPNGKRAARLFAMCCDAIVDMLSQRPITQTSAAILLVGLSFSVSRHAYAQDAIAGTDALVVSRFTFDPDADEIMVPVELNGKRTNFVLDTGATMSIFDTALRRQLGEPVRTTTLHGADGETAQVELFLPPPTKVAGLPFDDVEEVICLDLWRLRDDGQSHIRGVVGMDFLQNRVIRLDFDAGEVTFLRSVPRDAGVSVPLGFSPRLIPTVTLSVGGAGRRVFLVDTGYAGLSVGRLSSELLDPLIDNGNAIVHGTGVTVTALKSSQVREVYLREITLDEFRHSASPFAESDHESVGLGYLSRYIVTFNFPRMKMYLKPGRRFNEPSYFDLSGAKIFREAGATTVWSADDGSAASRAGLVRGDVLEQVDARPAAALSLPQIQKRLRTPGVHKLRIKRGEATLDVVLELARRDVFSARDARSNAK